MIGEFKMPQVTPDPAINASPATCYDCVFLNFRLPTGSVVSADGKTISFTDPGEYRCRKLGCIGPASELPTPLRPGCKREAR